MSAALEQNLDLLRQGVDLLERIDDAIYRGEDPSFETSYRVGPHLRHVVDAYGCLLEGLPEGQIDYDNRERNSRIETERSAGLAALEALALEIEALREADAHAELTVKADTPTDAPGAWSRSTLRRELQFLVGHTVHHFALIALILRRDGFEPGRELGVAPSTLRHWAREESIAR